jgi:flagellar protein FliS
MMHAYKNAQRDAAVESNDPHEIVAVLFAELVKSMRGVVEDLEADKPMSEARNKHFSRALTIIYSLQSSLNFEKGGEIAENLFRLYEYARQQLLESSRSRDSTGVVAATDALQNIREAWDQIKTAPPAAGSE